MKNENNTPKGVKVKYAYRLKNGKRNRYLIEIDGFTFTSAKHVAEHYNIKLNRIYRTIMDHLDLGFKSNLRPRIAFTKTVDGVKMKIIVLNAEYLNDSESK